MIDINSDREDAEPSPFQEEIILDNYFPCAGRAEVLSRMQQALQDGPSLMALTGADGSGKTMLSRMLAHEALCRTVFFPQAVDSFAEVVQDIAASLGLDQEIDREAVGLEQSVQVITDFLLDQSAELLVIFDEAENILLAVLDHIRQMFEQMTGAGAQLHILLSGQKTLLENCDQVGLGDFRHADASLFELSPLSEAETIYYLQFCAARLPGIDTAQVFTDEVVDDIYHRAQGNFRLTNILGEEAVQPHREDTSFMVLLEGVEERGNSRKKKSPAMHYLHLDGTITRYLPWIGGVVCGLFLLFFLFRPGGEEGEVGHPVINSQKADPVVQVAPAEDTAVNNAEKKELATMAPVEDLQPPEEEEVAVLAAEPNGSGQELATAPQPAAKEAQPLNGAAPDVAEQAAPVVAQTIEAAESAAVPASAIAPVVDGQKQEVAAAVPENIVPQPLIEVIKSEEVKDTEEISEIEKVTEIARLRPGTQVKKKTKPAVVQPPTQQAVAKAPVAPPNPAGDRLYKARLSAGSGWGSTQKKNMYTVQVMALGAKGAEKNLKNMLAQLNYRQEAGNFYIFEKKTSPAKVFVFYGEYPSLDRARLAEKSLPQFLRDYQPQALSINEAVAKIGR